MAKQKKPLPAMEWLQPRVRFTRWVSLIGYLALLLLIGVWNGVFADLHGARTWVVLSIVLVPLLILAPSVLLGHARGHAWLCFVVNIYFIQGVLAAFDRRVPCTAGPKRSSAGAVLQRADVHALEVPAGSQAGRGKLSAQS